MYTQNYIDSLKINIQELINKTHDRPAIAVLALQAILDGRTLADLNMQQYWTNDPHNTLYQLAEVIQASKGFAEVGNITSPPISGFYDGAVRTGFVIRGVFTAFVNKFVGRDPQNQERKALLSGPVSAEFPDRKLQYDAQGRSDIRGIIKKAIKKLTLMSSVPFDKVWNNGEYESVLALNVATLKEKINQYLNWLDTTAVADVENPIQCYDEALLESLQKPLDNKNALQFMEMASYVDKDLFEYVAGCILFDNRMVTSDDKIGYTAPEWLGIGIGSVSSSVYFVFGKRWWEEHAADYLKEHVADTSIWALGGYVWGLLPWFMTATLVCRFNAQRLYNLNNRSAYRQEKTPLMWFVWGISLLTVMLTCFNSPLLVKEGFTGEGAFWDLLRAVLFCFTATSPFLGNAFALNKLRDKLLRFIDGFNEKKKGHIDWLQKKHELQELIDDAKQMLLHMTPQERHTFANEFLSVHKGGFKNIESQHFLDNMARLVVDPKYAYLRPNHEHTWQTKMMKRLKMLPIILGGAISYYGFTTNIEQGNRIPEMLWGIDGGIKPLGYTMGFCSWSINGFIGFLAWDTLINAAYSLDLSKASIKETLTTKRGRKIIMKRLLIAMAALINAMPGYQIAADNAPQFLDALAKYVPLAYYATSAASGGYSIYTLLAYNAAKKTNFAQYETLYDELREVSDDLKADVDEKYMIVINKFLKDIETYIANLSAPAAAVMHAKAKSRARVRVNTNYGRKRRNSISHPVMFAQSQAPQQAELGPEESRVLADEESVIEKMTGHSYAEFKALPDEPSGDLIPRTQSFNDAQFFQRVSSTTRPSSNSLLEQEFVHERISEAQDSSSDMARTDSVADLTELVVSNNYQDSAPASPVTRSRSATWPKNRLNEPVEFIDPESPPVDALSSSPTVTVGH